MISAHRMIYKIFLSFFLSLIFFTYSLAQVDTLETGGFSFEINVNLPGSPEIIYDAITGDVSGWWDHTFSKNPVKLFIEAKPGGGFWEIFDEAGNGVLHATVVFADRGKFLRFDGPLGLSGYAFKMVTTYEFKPENNDSTYLKVIVRAMGEYPSGTPEIVKNVWNHFIIERFKPYIEEGKHLR